MTADKFLKDKGWYAGSLMLSKTKGQGLVSITEAMEEYHQAKLKLLGIANVVVRSEQLKAEVFTLANKLAVAGEGDAAVAMHKIHNRL